MRLKTLFITLILIFNFNSPATEQDSIVKDNLCELKQQTEQANRHNPKKFNELLTIVYDDLAGKIHEIEQQMGDKKTALTIKMHEEHISIQKDMVAYKQATKKKAKALRIHIVHKLEQLFGQIQAHTKTEDKFI